MLLSSAASAQTWLVSLCLINKQRDRLVDHALCSVLQATIDQVDGLMFFDGRSEQLLQWDSQIQGVCNQLNTIVDNIISRDVAMQA